MDDFCRTEKNAAIVLSLFRFKEDAELDPGSMASFTIGLWKYAVLQMIFSH